MTRSRTMRMARRAFLAGGLAVLALPCVVTSQHRVYRVGVMAETAAVVPWVQAFRDELRQRGYTEGTNLVIEHRSLDGALDRSSAVAAELIQLGVDVLLVGGSVTARAAKAQTTVIPIVFTSVGDPVGAGLVTSLARPGGNATGLSNINPELNGKQLELLKLAVPKVSRVAVLHNAGSPSAGRVVTELQQTARALRVELEFLELRQRGEVPRLLATPGARRVGGLLAISDPVLGSDLLQLAQEASKRRLPAIYARREFAEAGGLLAYGPSFADNYRRAAVYVDKIFKGASPALLPIEQPTKFEFVVNLRTARAFGLKIAPSLLQRADHVIE